MTSRAPSTNIRITLLEMHLGGPRVTWIRNPPPGPAPRRPREGRGICSGGGAALGRRAHRRGIADGVSPGAVPPDVSQGNGTRRGGVDGGHTRLVPDIVVPAMARATTADVDRLLVELFHREGRSLVRLARLFVDDRNAAEDLVQEAFIRLARSAHRIQDESPGRGLPAVDRAQPGPRPQPPGPGVAPPPPPPPDRGRGGRGRARAPRGPAAGDRRPAGPAPPAARPPGPALLPGARDRRHRGDDGDLPQLGQDPSPAGPGRHGVALGNSNLGDSR